MSDDEPAPKYRASDFMRKEIALFHRARRDMRSMRRFGDDDAPVPAIAAAQAVHAIRRVRLRDGAIDLDA